MSAEMQERQRSLDLAKAERLDEAIRLAEDTAATDGVDAGSLAALVKRYYRHVAAEDVVDRRPQDVLRAVLSHRDLADERPQGTAKVRVHTPSDEEDGWSAHGHTVVEVVTGDTPFLVDSVTAELTRHGKAIHAVVHPQLVVRRDLTGRLTEVCDASSVPPDAHDASPESWIHVVVDRETDNEEVEALTADLHRVLRDVRETVEDWPKMRSSALAIADELADGGPSGVAGHEVEEAVELLRWLADDHFTFMGYREYRLDDEVSGGLHAIPGTGLGILRSDQTRSESFDRLPPEVRERAREPRLLVLTKANSRSTVHRPAYLDYVGVKVFDEQGTVVGERRFLGLLTSVAYTESIERIPVLRRKAHEMLTRSGLAPTSHSGKALVQILETYPRDELFQISVEDLESIALAVLHLQERRQLRLFLRRDDYGRFMSCLVYLPRDRYTTGVRKAMEDILLEAFNARSVDYTPRITDSVLARLHFVVRVDPGAGMPEVDPFELEQRLVEAARSWDDEFDDALASRCGDADRLRLGRIYSSAFPEAYKEDLPAEDAVDDLFRLEGLRREGDIAVSVYRPSGAGSGDRRFKLFHVGSPVSLSVVLPRLQDMGVEVVDERPYRVEREGKPTAWVYDFGLRYEPAGARGVDGRAAFTEAFTAVWRGAAESDGFNGLVLRGGLSWRQATVLRAYAKYLRQAGSTFSQDYLEECLTSNVGLARLLVQLFEARFDPGFAATGGEVVDGLQEEIAGGLDAVESLDHDRILRSFLALIRATLRTNYFQRDADGNPKPYVSFKLDSRQVPDLPQPRPRYEIWVYGPRVEGVHLRFGTVARGGLRWSDRREDFRTEILGLVKAQAVKNAVIVPVGAKGGFVVKRPPAPTGDPGKDREALTAEGTACYQLFISGLLDVTDNIVSGRVVPPPDVTRHDGDDPYLVVAADKGTATFSDIANALAADYDFWLGDAFASGGSAGYDHKAMGITARGAWESVKRHFRELGLDTQSEEFTVAGVGDMSGDVFGNGMLLSEHIRLVAAFDHRHVFLDPDPDTATSFAERQRLFDLPRSSWADYDTSLISAGGGVYSRRAKSVPISPEVRRVLGLADSVSKLSPPELLKAILAAPVDLLWNGGIGTYVKASTETHADVGDKANDAIRVDGLAVRARVVGEGGNLGLTQLGRIEYSLEGCGGRGGRINTDAIDNSAGVDTSDHEVNIKILLDGLVRDGELGPEERNHLLGEMTDEVARLVLQDNYEQNVLLGTARAQAPAMLSVHARFIRALERRGELDRELEFLPSDSTLAAREGAGLGLVSSEFAVLAAYSKMTLTDAIAAAELPDEPWFARVLRRYFPSPLVQRYDDRLDGHRLRREIITTWVSNDLVNRAGITFVHRAQEETGASPVEIVRAYTVVREVFGFEEFWAAVEGLDNQISTEIQTMLLLEGRRLMDRSVRWLLQTRRASIDVQAEVERFGPALTELVPRLPELLVGSDAQRQRQRMAEFEGLGVPSELAARAAKLLDSFGFLDVVEVAEQSSRPVEEVAGVYFALSERIEVDRMLTRITALPRDDRWAALARSALRYDLYGALAGLTADVLGSTDGGEPVKRIEAWEEQNAEGVARARATLGEIVSSEKFDLATLSVAMRTIRTLLSG
jgi:glutamate dehydrogenase